MKLGEGTTSLGREIWENPQETDAVLVGISRGNPQFTEQYIERLLETMCAKFDNRVYCMLPDMPSVHTLMATGYTVATEAERKSRLDFNKISNAIQRLKLPLDRILRWDVISQQPAYQQELGRMSNVSKDPSFVAEADTATTQVLAGAYAHKRLRIDNQAVEFDPNTSVSAKLGQDVLANRLAIGRLFLVEELACILAAPKLTKHERVTYVYHRPMPILTKSLAGEYGDLASDQVGYSVVTEI
jgi:tRNA-dependent cyclodipeptide synthase